MSKHFDIALGIALQVTALTQQTLGPFTSGSSDHLSGLGGF